MNKINRVIMLLAGLMLLFATITKVHEMLTYPIQTESLWESWEFFLIQIPLEFGLALWLLSGLFRKAACSSSLSNIVTASKFFSRAFSCSMTMRRLASHTFIPPNCTVKYSTRYH